MSTLRLDPASPLAGYVKLTTLAVQSCGRAVRAWDHLQIVGAECNAQRPLGARAGRCDAPAHATRIAMLVRIRELAIAGRHDLARQMLAELGYRRGRSDRRKSDARPSSAPSPLVSGSFVMPSLSAVVPTALAGRRTRSSP